MCRKISQKNLRTMMSKSPESKESVSYTHLDVYKRQELEDVMTSCDSCVYNVYDEDDEEYYCEVDMDEDDAARLMQGHYKECPYYQLDDEYAVVRHQM